MQKITNSCYYLSGGEFFACLYTTQKIVKKDKTLKIEIVGTKSLKELQKIQNEVFEILGCEFGAMEQNKGLAILVVLRLVSNRYDFGEVIKFINRTDIEKLSEYGKSLVADPYAPLPEKLVDEFRKGVEKNEQKSDK